jgi:hypothetical protein
MRSIHVATVRRYVCNKKAVSAVKDIGASVDREEEDVKGDRGTARFSWANTWLGGLSSESRSRPSILVLKMSHVEAGCSKSMKRIFLGLDRDQLRPDVRFRYQAGS